MKLHLLTKDSNLDYPRVGWLPDLPPQARSLWERFGVFHAAEYPELILLQQGGAWHLYLGAVDSGRTDYMGARIRVSFFASGSVGEPQAALVIKLLAAHVQEVLCGAKAGLLSALVKELIQPGQPSAWPQMDAPQKEAVAESVLQALNRLPEPSPAVPLKSRWSGGVGMAENRAAFITFCRALLKGTMQGCAFSLANLSAEETGNALALSGDTASDYAVLLTTPADLLSPLKESAVAAREPVPVAPPPVRETPDLGRPPGYGVPSPSRTDSGDGCAQRGRFWRRGTALLVVLLGVMSFRSCAGCGRHQSVTREPPPKADVHEVKR